MGQRLLDVAVGTGLVAAEAARVLRDPSAVTGLDLSEGMLAEARRRLGPGVRLVQARAEALPVADQAGPDRVGPDWVVPDRAGLDWDGPDWAVHPNSVRRQSAG